MKNKKILIVDDKYGIRLLLLEVFKDEGYQVYSAANGQEALEIARNEKPDLAVLDIELPGMDGIEILKNIRMFDNEMKIIIMSAYVELDKLEKAFEYGVLKHFIKPFNTKNLKAAIKEIFQAELITRDNNNVKRTEV